MLPWRLFLRLYLCDFCDFECLLVVFVIRIALNIIEGAYAIFIEREIFEDISSKPRINILNIQMLTSISYPFR